MKGFIEQIIKQRNQSFSFDSEMDSRTLFSFLLKVGFDLIRGLKCLLLLRNPKRMMMGKSCSFQYVHKIKWGRYLKLGKQVHISGLGKKGVRLGENVSIGSYSQLIVSTTLNNMGEAIVIEDNVGIGEFSYIGGAGGVVIGKDTIIGQYLSVHPENHVFSDIHKPIRLQGVSREGIEIGEDCWIGSKVTILNGVKIGAHSVVAAGSVVTKSFPPFSVIGGIPARILKKREMELAKVK